MPGPDDGGDGASPPPDPRGTGYELLSRHRDPPGSRRGWSRASGHDDSYAAATSLELPARSAAAGPTEIVVVDGRPAGEDGARGRMTTLEDSQSQQGSVRRRLRPGSALSARTSSTKANAVTTKLEDLRDHRVKALERVQLRVLYVILILVVALPVIIHYALPFGTSLCVSLGILLFTLIADLDLDQFLARRPKVLGVFSVVTTAVALLATVELPVLWPLAVVAVSFMMHLPNIRRAIASPATTTSRLPRVTTVGTLLMVLLMAGAAVNALEERATGVFVIIPVAYLASLFAAIVIWGVRLNRDVNPTKTLCYVLYCSMVASGLSNIVAGAVPRDCTSSVAYSTYACVAHGDTQSSRYHVTLGIINLVLIPLVYLNRTWLYGAFSEAVRMREKTKDMHALGTLFHTGGKDPTEFTAEGARLFRCVKLSLLTEEAFTSAPSGDDYALSTPAQLHHVDYFVCVGRHADATADELKAMWFALENLVSSFEGTASKTEPTFWIDRYCLSADPKHRIEQLQYLPVFAAGCVRFVVLPSPALFKSLSPLVEVFLSVALTDALRDVVVQPVGTLTSTLTVAGALHDCKTTVDVGRESVGHRGHEGHGGHGRQSGAGAGGAGGAGGGAGAEGSFLRTAIRDNVGKGMFVDTIKQVVAHVLERPEVRSGVVEASGGFALQLERARLNRTSSRRRTLKRRPSGAELGDTKAIRELDRNHLTLQETIGQGQYGFVRRAEFDEGRGSGPVRVAVKVLKAKMDSEAQDELIQEAINTAMLDHVNVVRFIGAVLQSHPHMLVLEYCAKGALLSVLRATDPAEAPGGFGAAVQQLIGYTKQVAAGMRYIAGQRIVHRDLAARNVLVTDDDVAKIADFGMARDVGVNEITGGSADFYYRVVDRDRLVLPLKWAAPEVIFDQKFSEKSDVWSFGVTVWEIFSWGDTPYGRWDPRYTMDQVTAGYKLGRPADCPQEVYDRVLLPCLEFEAEQRVRFRDVVAALGRVSVDAASLGGGSERSATPASAGKGDAGWRQRSPEDQARAETYGPVGGAAPAGGGGDAASAHSHHAQAYEYQDLQSAPARPMCGWVSPPTGEEPNLSSPAAAGSYQSFGASALAAKAMTTFREEMSAGDAYGGLDARGGPAGRGGAASPRSSAAPAAAGTSGGTGAGSGRAETPPSRASTRADYGPLSGRPAQQQPSPPQDISQQLLQPPQPRGEKPGQSGSANYYVHLMPVKSSSSSSSAAAADQPVGGGGVASTSGTSGGGGGGVAEYGRPGGPPASARSLAARGEYGVLPARRSHPKPALAEPSAGDGGYVAIGSEANGMASLGGGQAAQSSSAGKPGGAGSGVIFYDGDADSSFTMLPRQQQQQPRRSTVSRIVSEGGTEMIVHDVSEV